MKKQVNEALAKGHQWIVVPNDMRPGESFICQVVPEEHWTPYVRQSGQSAYIAEYSILNHCLLHSVAVKMAELYNVEEEAYRREEEIKYRRTRNV